jgi:subtilisin-like proprotein convertase family protein
MESRLASMNAKSVIRMGAGLLGLIVVMGGSAAWAALGPPMTRSFTNSEPFQIFDEGPASLYPSTVIIEEMPGLITRVSVSVLGLNHSFPADIDILLVGPGDNKVMLMSDAGGSFPIDEANVTFADGFPQVPNSAQIVTATYSPANWGLTADIFPSPAPPAPYLIGLTNFTGLDPNGAWQLYVFDDALESVGSINNGWELTVTSAEVLPELSIVQQGQDVQLAWPASATGYVLEDRLELADGPVPWSVVTNAVIVINGQNSVVVPLDQSLRFFRLRK